MQSDDNNLPNPETKSRELPPAAKRALDEAEARRLKSEDAQDLPREEGGPKGPEPTRFGDWEKGGIASDF